MFHALLIIVHASFATASFVLGCLLMASLPASIRSRRFFAYYLCIWVAVVCLLTVVIVDWTTLTVVKQIAFAALFLLALYLLLRSEQARTALARQGNDWRKQFIGHVGFVMISLFDGFCIVAAIDLHLPPYVIAGVAVLGVVAGVVWIRRLVRREIAREGALPAAE